MYRAPTRKDLKKEIMQERLQKIIARAGIASRRHAELLIASGQVRVNERLGKETGVKMRTVRQPDATRGRAANYWYEARMRDTKKEELRRVLFKEKHPLEKLKRIGLGPLTVEGIPRGRYRLIEQKEAEKLRKFEKRREGKEKTKL